MVAVTATDDLRRAQLRRMKLVATSLLALAALSLLATIVARFGSEAGDPSDVVVDDVQGTAEGGWG